MVIRLNPRLPLVWRSPDTIQLGIDRPLVVLPGVTPALENVIAVLRSGVPLDGAVMLGRQAGAADAEITALLRALRPALEDTSPAPGPVAVPPAPPDAAGSPPTAHVDGRGPTANRIRALLEDLGIRAPEDHAEPRLAVVVGHYVLDPARHGRWLRRDIPHLPVVFSDSEVRLGPLVEPGAGPCLYCLELTRVDLDPAWPAIASQLLTREAPTETVRASIDVATRVAGLVQDRLRFGRSHLAAASLAIDAATGSVRRRAHRPHDQCGCRVLPGNVTVLAGSAAARRKPPS